MTNTYYTNNWSVNYPSFTSCSYTSPSYASPFSQPQKTFSIKTVPTYSKHIVSAVCDTDPVDLSTEHILKMVEAMKSKLMFKTRAIEIDHFECKMTPKVREIIVRAWKKLNMYGKQPPFIPRFDEYLNELPEKFNVEGGIIVKIVGSEDYGELYFELDAIQKLTPNYVLINDLPVSDTKSYTIKEDKSVFSDDTWWPSELPF